jgi:hypothetical protein
MTTCSYREATIHGALVAVIGMVVALIFHESGGPVWFNIAGFASMLPASMAGGHLALQRRAKPK